MQTFEDVVLTIPSESDKRFWKKYIYICLSFSAFLELDLKNNSLATQQISDLLQKLTQHKINSKKTWLFGFRQLIRMNKVQEARQLFGKSIGLSPHHKIFRSYLEFETQLGNFDRCEKLYKKWLQLFTESPEPWEEYLEFNSNLGKEDRVHAVFQLAVSGKFDLTQPEKIYKKYIDILTQWGQYEKVRQAYKDLLAKTGHIKVFLALGYFEHSVSQFDNMREVFEKVVLCR